LKRGAAASDTHSRIQQAVDDAVEFLSRRRQPSKLFRKLVAFGGSNEEPYGTPPKEPFTNT